MLLLSREVTRKVLHSLRMQVSAVMNPPPPTHHQYVCIYADVCSVILLVGALDATAQSQVKGVVLYGYTKNQQNNGKIPNYPAAQTKVYCNADDGVCGGGLSITVGHLMYTEDVDDAVQFLEGTISSATTSRSGTTTTAATAAATTSSAFGSWFGM